MLWAIIQWILVWLGLAIMVWPVFLALMSVTLTQGRKKAYWFMIGNSISDILFAALTYKWLILRQGTHSYGWRIIGITWACVFLIYGIYLLIKRETHADIAIPTKPHKRSIKNLLVMVNGFVLNAVNPSIFVFRVTVITHFLRRHHHPEPYITWAFIAMVLVTFIVTDIIKIHSASRILKKLTLKNLDTIHNIAWVLLIIASIVIAARIIF